MTQIPLPFGLVGTENLPKTRQSLTNCFNNGQGAIIPRPGIELIVETNGVARGQFVWQGSIYQVHSNELLKITDTTTGASTVIGTISGNAIVTVAIGFVFAVIVVKGGAIYSLDVSDTLSLISGDANYEASDAITFINDRFVFIPSNGANPAFFTDAAALTVGALNFFDAQELPDQNRTTFNWRNTLYIGGTDSFESFRDTGASPVPFTRLAGARLDYGFIGGLQAYADTFAFVGREKDQDHGIYLVSQGRAEKISNEAIDLILSSYTIQELSGAIGNRFKWRSHDILTYTLPFDSFGFLLGQWFLLTVENEGVTEPWNGGFINQFAGEYFSASDSFFGRLSSIKTEYGNVIPRIIDVSFPHPENEWFACQSLAMGVSQGFNAEVGTVGLAMSRNNVEYSEFLFRELGALGKYSDHLEWNPPGGLGAYDGFMGMRIYTTQAVEFSANGLVAHFRA